MEQLHVTVKSGKAVMLKSNSGDCLTTVASITKAIKPMSTIGLTVFYKSLTGQTVKRFASKGDAAKRIHKFIAPTGNGKKSGPKVVPSKKKVPIARTATVNKMLGKTKRIDIKTKMIRVLPHESKTFQKGSVRGECYKLVMESAVCDELSVEEYLKHATSAVWKIDETVALACLKKLAQVGQKVQTMELV